MTGVHKMNINILNNKQNKYSQNASDKKTVMSHTKLRGLYSEQLKHFKKDCICYDKTLQQTLSVLFVL